MNDTTVWYQSRTIWLNVIGIVVEALTLDQLGAVVPPEARPYIALVVGILNIVLRTLTSTSLTLTK